MLQFQATKNYEFQQRAKEEPQAHLETIPLLFIALMPACNQQAVFHLCCRNFSHDIRRGKVSDQTLFADEHLSTDYRAEDVAS